MLQTHTRNHHKGRSLLPSEEHNRVTQSLSELGYRTSQGEKYHQPPGQKPVDGLEVQNGFACPLPNHDGTRCSRVFLGDKTFARHLSDHPGRSKPSLPSCASEVQTLFSQGGLQLYFSVDSSLSDLDPSADSAYAYAVKILPQLPKPRQLWLSRCSVKTVITASNGCYEGSENGLGGVFIQLTENQLVVAWKPSYHIWVAYLGWLVMRFPKRKI
jgi:hypothetical protein